MVLALAAACNSGGEEPARPSRAASSIVSASLSALASAEIVPDGCDYLVVEGKHIVPRDASKAPFKDTADEPTGVYCYRGIDLLDSEAVSKLAECKPRGSGGGVRFACPGVSVGFHGLLSLPTSIRIERLDDDAAGQPQP